MRIHKLDGLRGFCSLMVVFYHYPQSFLPDFIFRNFFIRESWSFVDFFFVLSGFVISYNYSTLSNPNDFWLYIKKRIIRLYPLLFFWISWLPRGLEIPSSTFFNCPFHVEFDNIHFFIIWWNLDLDIGNLLQGGHSKS